MIEFMSDEQLVAIMGSPPPRDPEQLDCYCELAWHRLVKERGPEWERDAVLLAGVCAPVLWDWQQRKALEDSRRRHEAGGEAG